MKKSKRRQELPYEVRIEYVRPLFTDMIQVSNADIANATMRRYLKDQGLDHKEFFWVMLLSRSGHLLGICQIAEGTESGALVSVSEIMQLLLLSHAQQIILVHNHPSGNLKFSSEDIRTTHRVHMALTILGYRLNDHMVITTESYVSMANEGILEIINAK